MPRANSSSTHALSRARFLSIGSITTVTDGSRAMDGCSSGRKFDFEYGLREHVRKRLTPLSSILSDHTPGERQVAYRPWPARRLIWGVIVAGLRANREGSGARC